jgi:hypothetical protein
MKLNNKEVIFVGERQLLATIDLSTEVGTFYNYDLLKDISTESHEINCINKKEDGLDYSFNDLFKLKPTHIDGVYELEIYTEKKNNCSLILKDNNDETIGLKEGINIIIKHLIRVDRISIIGQEDEDNEDYEVDDYSNDDTPTFRMVLYDIYNNK